MTDPRILDLKRRIYAAAARHGIPPAVFAYRVELYSRALRWKAVTIKLGVSFDEFVEGMRKAGESLDAFRRQAEARGAKFSAYEPSEFS